VAGRSHAPASLQLWRAQQPAPSPANCIQYCHWHRRCHRRRQCLRRRRCRHAWCRHHSAAAAQLLAALLPCRRQAAVPLWAEARRRCPRGRARSWCDPPRPWRLLAAAPRLAPGPTHTEATSTAQFVSISAVHSLCCYRLIVAAATPVSERHGALPPTGAASPAALSSTACRISSAAAGSGTGEWGRR
jgi:hypothetical protein